MDVHKLANAYLQMRPALHVTNILLMCVQEMLLPSPPHLPLRPI